MPGTGAHSARMGAPMPTPASAPRCSAFPTWRWRRAGNAYQIKRGKRVAIIPGAGLLFRAPELWKAVGALGGAASVERFGALNRKGEPSVVTSHSVSAPPTVFTQLTVIDPLRKA
jgi:hypothetical protein